MATNLLFGIFEALNMDKQACSDALHNTMEWANFHKNVELHTWTGNANEKQILWHLLAYSYVPAMARRLAFWSLAGAQRQLPIDAGMPGGKFWFLPSLNDTHQLALPVPQVVDWLLDLLGEPSLQNVAGGLGNKNLRQDGNEKIIRTFQNWRNGTTPGSATITEYFPDDADLHFSGAFTPDSNLPASASFEAVLQFIKNKSLNAASLHDQIPMTVERLHALLDGQADTDERAELVRLITIRYAAPTFQTVRQHLTIARFVQDGYERLLKALCGSAVRISCTDPAKNKLLQLTALFQSIYNLTIQASKNADTVAEQDAWFEARLAPWDKTSLLLSITPSLKQDAHLKLAECLTRKFMQLGADSPLEDVIAINKEDVGRIIKQRASAFQNEVEEDRREVELIQRVRTGSPWRAIQAETSYWVVSQLAQTEKLPDKTREMALARMRELASTPGQIVGVISIEANMLLNTATNQRPSDIQQRIQRLLDEAEASAGYDEWKAPLLRVRAKHGLMQNRFDDAKRDFNAALAACLERNFGILRGEVARDALAVAIFHEGFIPQNHEIYYRDMLQHGMFPEGAASFEDAAVWCEEFFWSDLYQPYSGIASADKPVSRDFKAIFDEAFELVKNSDWDGLQVWLKRHASKLRKTKLKDARRDSVLLLWLKTLDFFSRPLKTTGTFDSSDNENTARAFSEQWRKAISLLLNTWPEQAKIADFKGQTPLMLVADSGDAMLTTLLAPLSDADAQDYLGRTALHAAVAARSPACVGAVLSCQPHVDDKLTFDEMNTALHTSVRFGMPENVRLIVEAFPGLVSKANKNGFTPLAMAKDILANVSEFQDFMHNENRETGSRTDFEQIITALHACE